MAWTAATISGDEWTAHQADKPCAVGTHCLMDAFAASATGGIWSQAGNTTDTDETASGYPTTCAYDGLGNSSKATAPDAVQTDWYLSFDLSANPIEFDTVAIFAADGPTAIDFDDATFVQLEIADDATFSTRHEAPLVLSSGAAYAVGTGPLSLRVFHTMLTHDFPDPKRYSNVAFLRIWVRHNAGLLQPLINELWLGRRRQLLHQPALPWDDRHEISALEGGDRATCGLNPAYTRHRGRAQRTVRAEIGTDAELEVFTDFWADCDYGARSFLWIESPATAPAGYLMVAAGGEPEFNAAKTGPFRRDLELSMIELDPFRGQA